MAPKLKNQTSVVPKNDFCSTRCEERFEEEQCCIEQARKAREVGKPRHDGLDRYQKGRRTVLQD